MDNKIYICRHGRTSWNKEGRVQGMTDIPLAEEGIEQARQTAARITERLADGSLHIDEILCSPLKRAQETARIIAEATGLPLREEPRLAEQNFGKWEGYHWTQGIEVFTEAKKRFFDSYEGGESMARLAQRIFNLLDELKADTERTGRTFLLVTHGGIGRMVHAYFNDLSNDGFATFQLENCEVKEYVFRTRM